MHRFRWFLQVSKDVGSNISHLHSTAHPLSPSPLPRVYRAYNHDGYGSVAACKIVSLYSTSPSTNTVEVSAPDLKELEKEVQVHRVLRHRYILEFIKSLLVKPDTVDSDGQMLVPGLYMLLELALGGDLFDKIGE
jgi:serine/threonine-protein kinase CHEK1